MFRFFLLASFLIASMLHQAVAQQPTPAQRDALRAACRSDFMANCSGVQPGTKDALECLIRNDAKLSASCKTAVDAVKPAAPAAAAPAASSEPAAQAPPAAATAPAAAPTEPKPAPVAKSPAPPPGAPHKPSAAQSRAVRAACRSDFTSNCSGVQPGGAAALQCLQRNAARLSAACRSAVAAIGPGAPAAETAPPSAAAPAAAAPPAPAVAPIGPLPMMRPREALQILRICGADARALCPDVQPGGGRLLSCLAQNASALSPGCYATLSAAAGR